MVSETPSSATEPLGAMNRASAAGVRSDIRAISGRSSRPEFGDAVDMPADDVPAKFVAEPQRALEIELRSAAATCRPS